MYELADTTLREQLNRIEDRIRRIEETLTVRPVSKGEDNLLTIKQAAKIYKLSTTTLYRMKNVQVKIGTNVRISRTKMDSHLGLPPGRLC